MSKFTPGPYSPGRPDTVSSRLGGPYFKAVYADSVQEPVDIPEAETLPMTVAEAYGRTPDEIHANARLFAAAPEMYDALRVVMETIDASQDRGDLPSPAWHWYVHARDILARIDGETEGSG